MNEKGVVSVTDFLPRPSASSNKPLLQWLIRRVECVRGTLPIQMQCAPAFNYARDAHVTTLIDDDSIPTDLDGQLPLKGNVRKKVYEEVLSEDFGQHTRTRTTNSDSDVSETEEGLGIPNVDLGVDVTEEPGEIPHKKALFESPNLNMDLRYVTHTDAFTGHGDDGPPDVELELLDLSRKCHKGLGVQSIFELKEGQGVSFIFRMVPGSPIPTNMSRQKCGAGESEADPTNAALKKQATEEKEEAKKDGDVVSDTVDRLDLSQATVGYVPPHKNNHATSVAVDLNVAVRHVGERGFAEGLEAGKKAAQRSGKTGRRPADDPFLTKDLVISLLQVRLSRPRCCFFVHLFADDEQILV
jgi:hypothetical protein